MQIFSFSPCVLCAIAAASYGIRNKQKRKQKMSRTKQQANKIIWSDKIKAFTELYNLFNCLRFRWVQGGEDHLDKNCYLSWDFKHLINKPGDQFGCNAIDKEKLGSTIHKFKNTYLNHRSN